MACKDYERSEREKEIADNNCINAHLSQDDRLKWIARSAELRQEMEAHKTCPACKQSTV